jgi:hypothetical protein
MYIISYSFHDIHLINRGSFPMLANIKFRLLLFLLNNNYSQLECPVKQANGPLISWYGDEQQQAMKEQRIFAAARTIPGITSYN